jgi:hypothetical protein
MELPYIAKLDIDVPDSVIESLTNLSSVFYDTNAVNVTRHKYLKYGRLYLQGLEDRTIPEEPDEEKGTDPFLTSERIKALSHWIDPDNKDIVVLRTFLDQHFNKYFQFTVNFLQPHSGLGRHQRHWWPRVFIPMHKNDAEFFVWDGDNVEHKMTFDVGHCYFFNTWYDHNASNLASSEMRIMSSFCIDPRNNFKLF